MASSNVNIEIDNEVKQISQLVFALSMKTNFTHEQILNMVHGNIDGFLSYRIRVNLSNGDFGKVGDTIDFSTTKSVLKGNNKSKYFTTSKNNYKTK